MIQNKSQLEQSPSGFFLCRRSTLTCDALHTVYTVVSLQSIQTVKVPEGSEVKVNWNITRQSCDAAHYDNNLSATVVNLHDGNPRPKSSVFIFALISVSFKKKKYHLSVSRVSSSFFLSPQAIHDMTLSEQGEMIHPSVCSPGDYVQGEAEATSEECEISLLSNKVRRLASQGVASFWGRF